MIDNSNKICLISLGCDKNLVDSEVMLGLLAGAGCSFTDDIYEADICIVNSCCFINDAKEESINNLLELADLKDEGIIKGIIVTGCLAQRYSSEIREEIPQVDAIVGTNAYQDIVSIMKKTLSGSKPTTLRNLEDLPVPTVKRHITTGGHYAYLKIAEGCDKHCSYCIIPKIRGNYRSFPMEYLIDSSEKMVNEGVKEIILVAQETSLYGRDIYGKKMLSELLKRLSDIRGLFWIRLLYCYPEEIDDELIDTIAGLSKVCHYLDLPMQHCNDRILKKMGRRTCKADLVQLVDKLRIRIPDITIRTTFITGFPGETEDEFEELMDFVDKMRFDRVGVFTYSAEEDTPAALFDGQIDEEVKTSRRNALMELQQSISEENGRKMKGRNLTAIIEGKLPDEHAYAARTYKDAPEVDGYIFIQTPLELMTGDIVEVTVTGSNEYDLIGEIKDEPAE